MPKLIKDNVPQIVIVIAGLIGTFYVLHYNVNILLATSVDHETRIRKLETDGATRDQREIDLENKVDDMANDIKKLLLRL